LVAFWAAAAVVVARVATLDAVGAVDAGFDEAVAGLLLLLLLLPLPNATLPLAAGASKDDWARWICSGAGWWICRCCGWFCCKGAADIPATDASDNREDGADARSNDSRCGCGCAWAGAASDGRLRRKLEVSARSEFFTAPVAALLLLMLLLLLLEMFRLTAWTLPIETLRDRGCVAPATTAVVVAAAETDGGSAAAATMAVLASNKVDT
jgi:hypothetical protein